MRLDGPLGLAQPGPGEQGEAQVDGGGVQAVPLPMVRVPRLVDQVLGERHALVLVGAAERLDFPAAPVLVNELVELVPWEMVHDLGEHELSGVHDKMPFLCGEKLDNAAGSVRVQVENGPYLQLCYVHQCVTHDPPPNVGTAVFSRVKYPFAPRYRLFANATRKQ